MRHILKTWLHTGLGGRPDINSRSKGSRLAKIERQEKSGMRTSGRCEQAWGVTGAVSSVMGDGRRKLPLEEPQAQLGQMGTLKRAVCMGMMACTQHQILEDGTHLQFLHENPKSNIFQNVCITVALHIIKSIVQLMLVLP